MGVLLKDLQIKTKSNANKRRRKKRRTEDFSSDSSSSSSSESESESEQVDNDIVEDTVKPLTVEVSLSGIDFNQDSSFKSESVSNDTKLKLSHIHITNHNNIQTTNKEDISKISEDLIAEEEQLRQQYLIKMMTEYDTELDELRVKPDFTAKSLPLLAKLLKNGGNVFDDDSLKTILKN